jgi:hypothetical protein
MDYPEYVAAADLKKWNNGKYEWDFGKYCNDFDTANERYNNFVQNRDKQPITQDHTVIHDSNAKNELSDFENEDEAEL